MFSVGHGESVSAQKWHRNGMGLGTSWRKSVILGLGLGLDLDRVGLRATLLLGGVVGVLVLAKKWPHRKTD